MNRLEKLRQKMRAENLDAYVVMAPENRRYLSGFTGSTATLLILLDQALLLTDFRYIEQATAQAVDFQVVKIEKDVYASLAVLGLELNRIGFEGDVVTYADFKQLQETFTQAELCSFPDMVTDLRAVKELTEIDAIRQAVKIADDSFRHILHYLELGQTEDEIALELEWAMRKAGASGRSFDFIVASGWRSAMPHGVASSKQIQAGELLTMDFGAIYQGYCSDITRTVCLGEPSDKQREIYEIVLAAQLAGIQAVAPGRTGREVDEYARKLIADAGYGEYFGHGLGHAVGLAIHEGPRLSPREDRMLEPGMVVTVEPGIYIPDWGGVRIEDIVLVTENGCEVLNQAPKELIIIE